MANAAEARAPQAVARYQTHEWEDLAPLVQDYLQRHGLEVDEAAFGVPGPVVVGRARCTNLPWQISAEALRHTLHIPTVTVINDVEATAAAIPRLQPDDIVTIHAAESVEHGNIGLVAPGTGLGQAFLTWDGARYRTYPSEGGHADFGPVTDLQCQLFDYLHGRLPHVSDERVCSGSGVPNLYAFLRDTGRAPEPPALAERLQAAEDPTAMIFEEALRGPDAPSICRQTLDLFIEILGGIVGNFALTVFATGGIYLGGGIPPNILTELQTAAFTDAAQRKGRLSTSVLLQRVAIHVIRQPVLALVGLAYVARHRKEPSDAAGDGRPELRS